MDLKESFGTDNFSEVYQQMLNCLNIQKIQITGDNNIENVYNYSLSDSNWKELQIKELRKGYESHSLR